MPHSSRRGRHYRNVKHNGVSGYWRLDCLFKSLHRKHMYDPINWWGESAGDRGISLHKWSVIWKEFLYHNIIMGQLCDVSRDWLSFNVDLRMSICFTRAVYNIVYYWTLLHREFKILTELEFAKWALACPLLNIRRYIRRCSSSVLARYHWNIIKSKIWTLITTDLVGLKQLNCPLKFGDTSQYVVEMVCLSRNNV